MQFIHITSSLGLCNNLILYLLKNGTRSSSLHDYNKEFDNVIKIHPTCTEIKASKQRNQPPIFAINGALHIMSSVSPYDSNVFCPSHLEMQCKWHSSSWSSFLHLSPILISVNLSNIYYCRPVVLRVLHIDALILLKHGEIDFWRCVHWTRQDATDCLIFCINSALWSCPALSRILGHRPLETPSYLLYAISLSSFVLWCDSEYWCSSHFSNGL